MSDKTIKHIEYATSAYFYFVLRYDEKNIAIFLMGGIVGALAIVLFGAFNEKELEDQPSFETQFFKKMERDHSRSKVMRCYDKDGNGNYDACSLYGQGPECKRLGDCREVNEITRCEDGDGDGIYDACTTRGDGPDCNSATDC